MNVFNFYHIKNLYCRGPKPNPAWSTGTATRATMEVTGVSEETRCSEVVGGQWWQEVSRGERLAGVRVQRYETGKREGAKYPIQQS